MDYSAKEKSTLDFKELCLKSRLDRAGSESIEVDKLVTNDVVKKLQVLIYLIIG